MKTTLESQEKEEEDEEEKSTAIWDLGSPLYDSYELVSLSYVIERHLMTLPSSSGGSSRKYNSKRISPVGPDDHRQHHQNLQTKGNTKSMANGWRKFVRKMLGRKRRKVGGRKNKSETLKAAGSSGFFDRFVSSKK